MKHLTILVPSGSGNNLSSIVGAYKIFSRANEFQIAKGKKPIFHIQLAGISKKVSYYDGLFNVKPHLTVEEISKTNLIIIPSLNHHYRESIKSNKILVEWIDKQYRKGSELAAICTGAFLLAASGLLNGRSCSTHWAAATDFHQMFPDVQLQIDKLITDEKGIYTNGGAYSFLNLIIYLIEKYYNRETAIYCAKVFQIEIDRNNQSEFTIFTGQKTHDDEMVKKAQSIIESRLKDKISIEQLSSKLHVGRRNFDRRFIKATGNTPVAYAQRVKMEAAKKSFENSSKNINEVMYDVGYNDVKAFREVFRKYTGMAPLEYIRKYHKDSLE